MQANQNFLDLQRQLADTEDRIAAGRRYYNATVRAYNTAIEQMPVNLVAGAFHFEAAQYFEITDPFARQAPAVSFGSARPSSALEGAPSAEVSPGPGGSTSAELPRPAPEQVRSTPESPRAE